MFGLLIVAAAAIFGAVAAIILLVAWAVRREDACLTMADLPPGRAAHVVRRLLDLHVVGVDAYGQDPRSEASFTATGRQPDTDPSAGAGNLPGSIPGPWETEHGHWDTGPRTVAPV